MFDHVKFGVSDYEASKAFFLKTLEPLGVAVVSEGPPTYGVEFCAKGNVSLCLYQTEDRVGHQRPTAWAFPVPLLSPITQREHSGSVVGRLVRPVHRHADQAGTEAALA
jgi:catechol 2,3-dioxygenase-like lactoylglutathione lyase family enzyme